MHDVRMLPSAVVAWMIAALLVEEQSAAAWGVTGVALIAAMCLIKFPALAIVAVSVGAVCAGVGLRVHAVQHSVVTELAAEGRSATLIVEPRRDARGFGSVEAGGAVAPILIRHVESPSGAWSLRERATAFVHSDSSEFVVGRQLTVMGSVKTSGRSDEVATVVVRQVLRSGEGAWWWSSSERVRQGVRDAVKHRSGPAAALVPALVAGDESGLDEQTKDDFRRTGLTHLLAVSGTNLTIVLGAVLILIQAAGMRRFRMIAAGFSIVAFVLVARPEPSVLRAAVMGAVAVVALGRGTRSGIRALSWAILILLLADPWLSRQAGFVLSVSATAGIIVLGPSFTRRLSQWLPRPIALALAVPLAAQLACTPALAAISGEVSLVALFANVVAAPAVAPATITGLAAGLLALLWHTPASLLGTVSTWCAQVIVWSGQYAAGATGASIGWSAPWWTLVFITPIITWLLLKVAVRPVVATGLIVGLVIAMLRPPSPGWPPENLLVLVCDVGQGDGAVIPLGHSSAIVVDTGEDPGPIDRCLRRLDIDHISLLVFSHGDADHAAGWQGVTRGRTVAAVLAGPGGSPQLAEVPTYTAAAGDQLTVGSASVEVLWPPVRPRSQVTAEERNDLSLVTRISYRGVRILFTGDLGEVAQRQLLRRSKDVRADILKVAHHGSADQSPEFHAAVKARVATISSGKGNSYGHPAPSLLNLLSEHRIAWWRTDLYGDLAIVADDRSVRVMVLR